MRLVPIVSIVMSCLALNAETIHGKGACIADGDTIMILDGTNNQGKIRLNRIDMPEKSQAYGDASRKHLAKMVAGESAMDPWEFHGTQKSA